MLATPPNSTVFSQEFVLLRLETMGQVGRFLAPESLELQRSDRVVCRSARGLEVGSVLGRARCADSATELAADGKVLRKMTPADQLLWGHLRQLGNEAHSSCVSWLAEQGYEATLLEVEPLLDGRTLYFHFLAEVSPEIQSQLDRLVALYETQVKSSQFAMRVEEGCGPACGTQAAEGGCGTQSACAICKVASQCGK